MIPILSRSTPSLGVSSLLAVLMMNTVAPAERFDLQYPKTRQADVVDDYHGTKVPDPYRWLEDDNSDETKAWVEAQNKVTFGFLHQIPERDKLRDRIKALLDYERYDAPHRRGGKYFWTYNPGLKDQRILYVADALGDGKTGEPRVLLDPNTLSADGTTALTSWAPSEDGTKLAYGLQKSGSDWQEFRVRDVATGKDTDDLVQWVKFSSASWMKDGSGFFYSRYDEPKPGAALTAKNEFQKLYFHRLGTPQSEDRLIYERKDHPDWGFYGGVTDDGRYLVISVTQGTDPKNRVFYQELGKADSGVVELLTDFDADYTFIDNDGSVFYFRTDLKAPRNRLIAIDIAKPHRANWQELIPEGEHKLDAVNRVGGLFFCDYLKDAHSVVKCYGLDAGATGAAARAKLVRDLELPGIGSVSGLAGRNEDKETFYSFTSFTVPGTIYRVDVPTGKSSVFRSPKVDFDPAGYETKQVFLRSKDGTRVPMFITHKRGIVLNGTNPTLLYGYGGFNASLTPAFRTSTVAWMELGGVYAMANLRGGGEYGSQWHLAGTKLRKQNVFDDFIAAAEWLIAEKYTSPEKLAIKGGSNGGLLVGACMTQRPELFGAALPSVGVMDMLRFHKFTIGWAWTSDYGSADNADEFKALRAYSPLHALRPGVRYPATFITTADHDDRVVPAHSFKFAARLQECQAPDGPPVLIRIETNAGHGSGNALRKVIEEAADEFAFLVEVLRIR